MNSNNNKIAIIGLGYVGLPLAVEFGKFFQTIGYDINPSRIKELDNGIDVTMEVEQDVLKNVPNLSLSSNINDLHDSNIFIITVPTPIDNANRPNLNPIKKASEAIGRILKINDIVIYESTVFPGCTEEICVPILENISGLSFNKDFFCGYSPERINPGDKVNTLSKIKKITSGSLPDIATKVDDLYKKIITAGTFLAPSMKVAEAAKVIENTQRDINIALVNELSVIFSRLDIDTIEVLEAAGSKWNFLPFRPGLVGGHCIGVDPYYLTHKAEQVGYNPQVILAGRRINDNMAPYLVKKVVQMMLKNNIEVTKSTVGVMGITFKENCPDIRNTKVFDIIKELQNWNINPVVIDPWADKSEVKNEYGISLTEINKDFKVDSLIMAVGHKEFRELDTGELRSYCKGDSPVIADVKSLYNRHELSELGFSVFRL
jgi:UDP-N-acetyl-D-glucosamine/UDP-N-acetyl-D-galactosamine dehydrogenase